MKPPATLKITVIGTPAPQGSKRAVGRDRKGRVILIEQSKNVKPWREAVVWAAREVLDGTFPVEGPLHMRVVFTMRRPKSARKAKLWPSVRPDLSKLLRSTEDALTDAGVWYDDAQVVSVEAVKVYTGDPMALDVPGAEIVISRVGR